MVSELDIWRSAAAMIEAHGPAASKEAAKRAKEFLDSGDNVGAMLWHRIGLAVQRLQTTKHAKSETQH